MSTVTKSKRGHVVLEAAIFMPMFIIGIVTLIFIIKYAIVYEMVVSAGFENSRQLSRDMYVPVVTILNNKEFEKNLEDENMQIYEADISAAFLLPLFAGTDSVRMYQIKYYTDIPVLLSFKDKKKAEHTFIFRPFVV